MGWPLISVVTVEKIVVWIPLGLLLELELLLLLLISELLVGGGFCDDVLVEDELVLCNVVELLDEVLLVGKAVDEDEEVEDEVEDEVGGVLEDVDWVMEDADVVEDEEVCDEVSGVVWVDV